MANGERRRRAPTATASRIDLRDDAQLAVPLVPLECVAELPSDAVRRDGGSRDSRILLASDMTEYYAKSPVLMPGHPYLGANEFVVTRLARMIGIPTRATEVIRWGGELYVGSSLIENDRKMTGVLTPQTWARLRNAPAVAYDLVVLDGWTLNADRHCGNWLGGVLAGGVGYFLANDHDAALLAPGVQPSTLHRIVGEPLAAHYFRCDVVRGAIDDRQRLRAAVARATRIDDASLTVVVGQTPDEWLSPDDKIDVLSFLSQRRDLLEDLFAACDASVFPNLGKET